MFFLAYRIGLVCSSYYPLKQGVLKKIMNIFLHQLWISVECSIQNCFAQCLGFFKNKHIPAKFNISNDLRSWWLLLMVMSREFHGSIATSPTLELILEVKGIRPLPRQCVGGWGLKIYRSMCIDMCVCSSSHHISIYIYLYDIYIYLQLVHAYYLAGVSIYIHLDVCVE